MTITFLPSSLSLFSLCLFPVIFSLAHSLNLLLLFAALSRVFLNVFFLRFHIYFCIGTSHVSPLCHRLILLTISFTCITSFIAQTKLFGSLWTGCWTEENLFDRHSAQSYADRERRPTLPWSYRRPKRSIVFQFPSEASQNFPIYIIHNMPIQSKPLPPTQYLSRFSFSVFSFFFSLLLLLPSLDFFLITRPEIVSHYTRVASIHHTPASTIPPTCQRIIVTI